MTDPRGIFSGTPRWWIGAGAWVGALAVLAVFPGCPAWDSIRPGGAPRVSWAVVLPDGADLRSDAVQAWQSAAREEGYALDPFHDSDLLRPWSARRQRHPVLIFPDGLHPDSPAMILELLRAQLARGDSVLLAADALSKNFPGGALSAICERVRMDFGYGAARFGALTSPLSLAPTAALESLIPPGTFSDAGATPRGWTGYQAPDKPVAHAETSGRFPGQVEAIGAHGETLLGTLSCGPGRVVIANLPLTYLKRRTDGSLLHATLKLVDRAASPAARLLPVPDGVGGLVFNIHVDSNAAIEPLKRLDRQGFFGYGPFSVHVTAGPDAREPGDGLGFDVDGRADARALLVGFAARGHAIGSHGGWIHDYFGKGLGAEAVEPYLGYLRRNFESLEKALGQPVTEYSAPLGNHPAWVTGWLERRGVNAYYTTADVGLGPTRTYLDGRRIERSAWSFPVNVLGTWASLEEFHEHGIPRPAVLAWLEKLSGFAADAREARLVYSHPPGIQEYSAELFEWLRFTRKLEEAKRFRWYKMGELAAFLTRREKAAWSEEQGSAGQRVFKAASGESLAGLTWCLPKSAYSEPRADPARASLSQDGRCWLVRAGDVKALEFAADRAVPPPAS